jgi:hypothetical protein
MLLNANIAFQQLSSFSERQSRVMPKSFLRSSLRLDFPPIRNGFVAPANLINMVNQNLFSPDQATLSDHNFS